jgi:hypothetical protein
MWRVKDWAEFTVVTGGAAAALVGLLFVSVSIRADLVARSTALRSRLAQILTIFLGLLCAAIFVSLPNPAPWVLGVELLVTAVAMATAFIVLNHRAEDARTATRSRLEGVLDRLNPNVTTAVLVGISGLALVFGFEWGLFLLAVAAVAGFVGGAIGAWLVLVRPEG